MCAASSPLKLSSKTLVHSLFSYIEDDSDSTPSSGASVEEAPPTESSRRSSDLGFPLGQSTQESAVGTPSDASTTHVRTLEYQGIPVAQEMPSPSPSPIPMAQTMPTPTEEDDESTEEEDEPTNTRKQKKKKKGRKKAFNEAGTEPCEEHFDNDHEEDYLSASCYETYGGAYKRYFIEHPYYSKTVCGFCGFTLFPSNKEPLKGCLKCKNFIVCFTCQSKKKGQQEEEDSIGSTPPRIELRRPPRNRKRSRKAAEAET